ncbi:hypothetical protein [Rhizobium leguminosarum]
MKLLAVSLSVSFATASGGMASETTYYNSKPWEVVLHVPDVQNERSYCAVRTSLWNTRTVSVETQIGAADAVTLAIRIRKENWKLPLNQTTSVGLTTVAGIGAEVTMKAISEEELYYAIPHASVDPSSFILGTVLQQVFAARQPPPLSVKFAGNEPMWTVPPLDRYQTIELNEASNRCDVDLRGLQASATDTGDGETSPFSAAASTANPTAQSPNPISAQAPSDWEFYTRDEDWGPTCFAQTHRGIVMVGFMGSPGKDDLVGFVSSLFTGETRATWHVDDKPAYVSDGGQSDYFSWHEFGQLPTELLDQMSQGREMAVTGAKGERVTVSLTGAAEPLSKFKACFGTLDPDSAAAASPARPK